jgi:hypothetical protein
VQGFNALRLLNLEDNHIVSWDEMVKLSYLRRYKIQKLKLLSLSKFYFRISFGSFALQLGTAPFEQEQDKACTISV